MSEITTRASRNRTFSGGLHPPQRKYLAADAPIEVLPTPSEVSIAMLQHLGAPCEATVKRRAEVNLGDVVGEAKAYVSAPVHASVSGTIMRASMATLPNGRHVSVIPIKASAKQPLVGKALFADTFGVGWPKDGQALFDDIFCGQWPTDNLEQYEPEQIAEAAKRAGLVGQGGAAFPTHVKLTRNPDKPIAAVLINGCECEPYLSGDYRLMLETPAPVITGALLTRRASGATKVIVCIEDNKPKAVEALRSAAKGTAVEVRVLKTKYPQGGEKQLIAAVLGKEVPTGGLPLDVGVVVFNVGTAAALARAVIRGRPLTHRIVTVSGAGIRQPKNLLVPIGTCYSVLLRYCGGLTADAARVVAGGPMMGFSVPIGDDAADGVKVPVTKGTSGITVLTHQDVRRANETTCVRCGRCVQVCPMRLVPTRLALAARCGNRELLKRYHVAACMECGCCAYACPANIPLVQLLRVGKVMLHNSR